MNFGEAIELMKNGRRITRSGWNGRGMFLFMVWNWQAVPFDTGNGYMRAHDTMSGKYPKLPFVAMKTADDKIVPWLASQTDILSDDWSTFEG